MHASSRFAHFLSYCLLHPTLLVGIASKVTQKVRRRLLRRSSAILDSCVEQQHLRAKTWCSTHAVNIADLSRHLPFSFVALRVEEIYPDYITGALLRSRTCPATVGGSANLDLLFSLARSISARRIVETGVAFGWSSLASFVGNCRPRAGLHRLQRRSPVPPSLDHSLGRCSST